MTWGLLTSRMSGGTHEETYRTRKEAFNDLAASVKDLVGTCTLRGKFSSHRCIAERTMRFVRFTREHEVEVIEVVRK